MYNKNKLMVIDDIDLSADHEASSLVGIKEQEEIRGMRNSLGKLVDSLKYPALDRDLVAHYALEVVEQVRRIGGGKGVSLEPKRAKVLTDHVASQGIDSGGPVEGLRDLKQFVDELSYEVRRESSEATLRLPFTDGNMRIFIDGDGIGNRYFFATDNHQENIRRAVEVFNEVARDEKF